MGKLEEVSFAVMNYLVVVFFFFKRNEYTFKHMNKKKPG